MTDWPLLSVLIFTPLIGAVVVAGLDGERPGLARRLGSGFALLSLLEAGCVAWVFDPARAGLQMVERMAWVPSLGAEYHLGVDGLSVVLVLLTALVVPFGLVASWRVEPQPKAFVALFLFLEAGLFGTFTAMNFFHWFIFWELGLIPAYFLIKLWGGPNRVGAATQFFVYTMVGSVAMLLGFLAIFLATGSFDFEVLAQMGQTGELSSRLSVRLGWYGLSEAGVVTVIFLLVLAGFAVKVPLMPFHTWLPAAYAEAPTGVSMVLTGVMSKMGVYGLLRLVLPLFEESLRAAQTPLLWLAVLTVVGSALAALQQRDLKRLLGYSSINHLGYCLLGIFAVVTATDGGARWGTERSAVLSGVVVQMFSHGVTAAALFWFVGMLESRGGGRRGVLDFGGLRKVAPVFCGLMGIATFASLGLPGLSGFVGEFLIFKGTFPLAGWAAVLALPGLLVTAVFLLTVLLKVFHGPLEDRWRAFPDLSVSERLTAIPAVGLMLVVGVFPGWLLQWVNPAVVRMVEQLK